MVHILQITLNRVYILYHFAKQNEPHEHDNDGKKNNLLQTKDN